MKTAPVQIVRARAYIAPGYPPATADNPVHEYHVYVGEKLVRVCPSIGMAQEVAAGY